MLTHIRVIMLVGCHHGGHTCAGQALHLLAGVLTCLFSCTSFRTEALVVLLTALAAVHLGVTLTGRDCCEQLLEKTHSSALEACPLHAARHGHLTALDLSDKPSK